MKRLSLVVWLSAASAVSTTPRAVRNLLEGSGSAEPAMVYDVPEDDYWKSLAASRSAKLCVVNPDEDGGDDAPAIVKAFTEDCRTNSIVVLPGPKYNIRSFMDTTGLENVEVHHFGRFLWSPDIDYWLSASQPIGFQNQSTVWYFGGDHITYDGHNVGTFDGNGQNWYDWAEGKGNLKDRPMMINWVNITNSEIRRLRLVQSQMWTQTVSHAENILMEDIYVNNTSNSEWSTLNTDGIDTMWANNVTLRRWAVTCGDDGVALKRNSTNIHVYDSEFWGGQGLAVGSLGQYDGVFEEVDGFFVKNVTFHDTAYVAYLKTWPGVRNGYPPNGGGGGYGYARNIVIEDAVLDRGRRTPYFITQCENYEGHSLEDCDSSEFEFYDVTWRNTSGTVNDDVEFGGWFICSEAAGGCNDFKIEGFTVKTRSGKSLMDAWDCHNMNSPDGFSCSVESD
ncbi:glycosyl hydrolases family 28 domain-containing protein [Sarocladium implicatum]|nr:glycosyl hydrolases family 28 domain-containing protein [Sarocladium implicatum]